LIKFEESDCFCNKKKVNFKRLVIIGNLCRTNWA